MAEAIDRYDVEQETGLSYEQRWQIIQHFTEWIRHGDSKIQMLLTVQGGYCRCLWSACSQFSI